MWPTNKKGLKVFSQSQVAQFLKCPREVYYNTILGITKTPTPVAITRGLWVHTLLEYRAKGLDYTQVHTQAHDAYAEAEGVEAADAMAVEVEGLIRGYEQVYDPDPLTPLYAELKLSARCLDNAVLVGIIDLVATDKDGAVWLVDHKTHRAFPPFEYRELAFQHHAYLWLARNSPQWQQLGLPQPVGFIYDYIKTGAKFNPKNVYEYYRRDRLCFSRSEQDRAMLQFFKTADRMINYDWAQVEGVETNPAECSGYACGYKDLVVSDLHGGWKDLPPGYVRVDPYARYKK